jgi:hypothetical protein
MDDARNLADTTTNVEDAHPVSNPSPAKHPLGRRTEHPPLLDEPLVLVLRPTEHVLGVTTLIHQTGPVGS